MEDLIGQAIRGASKRREDTFEERVERYVSRTGNVPHGGQMPALRQIWEVRMEGGPKPVFILNCGKQSGKSEFASEMGAEEFYWNPAAHVWVAAGVYDHAEIVYNKSVSLLPSSLGEPSSVQNFKPKFREWANGGFIKMKSWQDPEIFEGEQLDLLVCDESQTLDEERFARTRPRMLKRSGLPLFIGSVWETSTFWLETIERAKTSPNMRYITWTTEDNPDPAIQANLAQERLDLDPETYAQLYLCKPRKLSGLILKRFARDTHVRELEYSPEHELALWIDPGHTVYACLFVQVVGENVHVLDEVYLKGDGTDQRAIVAVGQHPLYEHVSRIVMDVAGRAHRAESGSSSEENWREYTGLPIYGQKVDIKVGIMRLESFIWNPRTEQPRVFMSPSCANLIDECQRWRYNNLGTEPIKEHDHGPKALYYGIVERFGFSDRRHGRGGVSVWGPQRIRGRLGKAPRRTTRAVR